MLLTTIDFVSGDIFLTFPFTNEGGGGGGGESLKSKKLRSRQNSVLMGE